MPGCEGQDNCSIELADLPLLTGCPADDEWMLFGNASAAGGRGKYGYGRRTWGTLKACIAAGGGSYAAISALIASDSSSYQNDALKGASELAFVIVNKQLYTYEDGDFAFNSVSGTIAFLTITLFTGDKLVAPYKSA